MSAFVVDKVHIDALVTAGLELAGRDRLAWFERDLTDDEETDGFAEGQPWGPGAVEVARNLRRELTAETAERVGQMLWAENVRSVNHRYAEEDWEEIYTFDRLPGRPEAVAVLAALSGYEYQSCEHPGWTKSEAFRFVDALRGACIRALPGYDAGPWHITERSVFQPKPVVRPIVQVSAAQAERATIASDRNATIKHIRSELRRRSGKAWSVTGGRGTAWGWISISAPPARMNGYRMTEADMAELGDLLGFGKPVHCQGVNVAASSDYRREYIDRASGVDVSTVGTPYWD